MFYCHIFSETFLSCIPFDDISILKTQNHFNTVWLLTGLQIINDKRWFVLLKVLCLTNVSVSLKPMFKRECRD